MAQESIGCLVTGGAGYIGSHVVPKLLNAGHKVCVIDNLSTGSRSLLDPRAEFVLGDIGDQTLCEELFSKNQFQAVFHFAGKVDAAESVDNPLLYYTENFEKPLKLLQVASRFESLKYWIFSSTAAVYGNVGNEPVAEDFGTNPMNPYGMSKLLFEKALLESSLKHIILRYFNVCGASLDQSVGPLSQDPRNLFRSLALTALGKRTEFEIFGDEYPTKDGTAIRDYIHVEDLSDAHLKAFEYLLKTQSSEIINLGSGSGHSVKEILSEFQKIQKFPFRISKARKGDPSNVVASIQKARNLLKFSPEARNLEQMVQSTFAWEQKRLNSNRT